MLELAGSRSFAQCEKDISTDPLNPINSEFLQLTTEWYGDNGPYTVNSMLNTWSWFPPSNTPYFDLDLTTGWASDLPNTLDLSMNNPFFGVGNPTFIHAQANNYQDRDWKWEDGWELLYMNMGRYPDTTSSTQLTPDSYWGENGLVHFPDPDNVPYFVLYNRYRGTMRVFANVWKTNLVPNSQEFMVQIRFDPLAKVNKGLSGILRHAGTYDTPLDQPTNFEKHYSPRQAPTTKTNWMVTDFQMGFDPCICMKEVNDTTQLGKLQFVFSDINTTNIEMTSRSIAVDEEITEAGLMDDFLNMSELNTGDYEPGQRIYTKMEDLYADYLNRLEKYREELDEQRSDFNFLKAFLDKVAPALTNTFVDGWTYDSVIPKLKEDSVMGTKSDEEVKAELDEARKKYELNFNDNNQFGTKALQSLTKGILGIGFDFLNLELFPKSPAPVKPTAPVATFTETVYKGTISDTSFTPGPQLYQPGGITYGNDTDGYWGYGKADLGFTSLPAYNKVLGQVALLETPPALIYSRFDTSITRENWWDESNYRYCSTNFITEWDYNFKLRLNEDVKIAINNSLDFDLEQTHTYVNLEITLAIDEPVADNGSSIPLFEIGEKSNLALTHNYIEANTRIIKYNSQWIPFDLLNQYVFSLEHSNQMYVDTLCKLGPVPVAGSCLCFAQSDEYTLQNYYENESSYSFSLREIKLKFSHDMYFEQIGSQGDQINTTQVHSYLLFANEINLLDDGPSTWELEPTEGSFDQYIPGLLSIGNEDITLSHPYVSHVIGNEIFINAQKVLITGELEIPGGYSLVIQALEEIKLAPAVTSLNPRIHLRIKKDFYDTPVFEYADNDDVAAFCNNSNAYQANFPTAALQERINQQLAEEAMRKSESPTTNSTSLLIFPNPARSELTLRATGGGLGHITIYDTSGRPVMQANAGGGASEHRMDIGALAPGIYIVQATCGDEVHAEKLVVAR